MQDGFAQRLLHWYDQHGRHDLPWQDSSRHRRTPYRVWISEVMLQQTQVATVIPFFERFVAALPTLAALAAAPEDRVLALWSGLGYYRRARHLHAAAKVCMERHAGELPRDFAALSALPGIGRSTAGAILALAFDQRYAILDGNVKRVLARFHGVEGWPGEPAVEKRLWTHAIAHTPDDRTADYTQAIMDLGATVCTRTQPRCGECPQARHCAARRDDRADAIPAPRPTRTLPERQTFFLILRDRRGRVLLERRPPTGIWPGLWSLPEAADARAAHALAERLAELGSASAKALPEIRHAFTHFKLRAMSLEWRGVHVLPGVADAAGSRWCARAEIAELGIPAPVRGLLQRERRAADASND